MNKGIVLGIVILFIGVTVVSSTDNIKIESPVNHQSFETVDNPKVMSACDHLAYIGGFEDDCSIYEFSLNEPGNLLNCTCGEIGGYLSNMVWAPDSRLYFCEYNSGGLWVLDLEDCSMENIGGGGTSCNSLAWDPVYNKLYGAGSSGLYEYDPETGEQEFIGSYGISNAIIGIAINSKGECYAWDVLFSGSSTLYTINLETGEATEIGQLGMTLSYAQDGDFCKEDDILYLATYTTNPYVGQFLYECNVETGNCSLIGEFHEYAVVSAFTIPYNFPPVTTIKFDPPEPNGENGWYVSNVTVTLNATDYDDVNATYYRINSGKWEIYDSPFVLSEDGDDIQIDYYSVDNTGKEEDVKSAWLDIDKTPPNVTVEVKVKRIGWRKWLITIIITSNENTSGMDRVEFFLNDGLQSVVSGSGPTYSWSWVMYGDLSVSIKVIIYDNAGNSVVIIINSSDISYHHRIKDIFTQQYTYPLIIRLLERFPLLERFLNTIQGGRI